MAFFCGTFLVEKMQKNMLPTLYDVRFHRRNGYGERKHSVNIQHFVSIINLTVCHILPFANTNFPIKRRSYIPEKI